MSLLPAHIARVMKAEVIQRLQGPNFGQVENTNNFHNLYVQRHTNVRYLSPPMLLLSLSHTLTHYPEAGMNISALAHTLNVIEFAGKLKSCR